MRWKSLIFVPFLLALGYSAAEAEAEKPGAVVVYRDSDPRSAFLLLSKAEREEYELEEWPRSGFYLLPASDARTPSGRIISEFWFSGFRRDDKAIVSVLALVTAEGKENRFHDHGSAELTEEVLGSYELSLGESVIVEEVSDTGYEEQVMLQVVESLEVFDAIVAALDNPPQTSEPDPPPD